MKSEEEIDLRRELFVSSYHFPKSNVTSKKKALIAAINASVRTRKYPVYSDDISGRIEAVYFWKDQLEKLGNKYMLDIQDKNQFLKDVYALQKSINKSQHAKCFYDGKIRIGQCQKSLSIYLKWMWCQRELAGTPPVCPIDGQVLSKCYKVLKKQPLIDKEKLGLTHTKWSNLNDKTVYEKLVSITEEVARLEGESESCVWELFAFEEPTRK